MPQFNISGGGGGGNDGGPSGQLFLFADGEPQIGNQYGNWADLFAKIGTLLLGVKPIVRFTSAGTPFTIPLAGMPVDGWDFRGGSMEAAYQATGATVAELPDGVFLANLGGVNNGMVLRVNTDVLSPNGSLINTLVPAGGAIIFTISYGARVEHTVGTAPMIQSPNGANPTTMVLAQFQCQQNESGVPPTGALINLNGNDGAVGVQINCGPAGGLQDGWLTGGGPGSFGLDIRGIDARIPLIPGYTGNPLFAVNSCQAFNLLYTPAAVGDWSGTPPTDVANALDRIAAAIGPIP